MKKEKRSDRYLYPAIFTYTEDGIEVDFPDLELHVAGKNEKEAYLTARVALGRELFDREQRKEELPTPTCLKEIGVEEQQAATLIDVYMPSVRMAENHRSVNRMVTLPAWLNAVSMERNVNFSQILQEALKKEVFHDYLD